MGQVPVQDGGLLLTQVPCCWPWLTAYGNGKYTCTVNADGVHRGSVHCESPSILPLSTRRAHHLLSLLMEKMAEVPHKEVYPAHLYLIPIIFHTHVICLCVDTSSQRLHRHSQVCNNQWSRSASNSFRYSFSSYSYITFARMPRKLRPHCKHLLQVTGHSSTETLSSFVSSGFCFKWKKQWLLLIQLSICSHS